MSLTYDKTKTMIKTSKGKTNISDEINTILIPRLSKIETRLERLTELMKKFISKRINFIKAVKINWIENPKKKLGGILDYGAILTVSGADWTEAYIKRNNLNWEDLDPGKSTERFRFGDGGPMSTKMTVRVPFIVTDAYGNDRMIKIKVYVVNAKVPLLVGKDAHQKLNICVTPASSTCELREEDARSTYKLVTTPGGHWSLEFEDISKTLYREEKDDAEDVGEVRENTDKIIGIMKKMSKYPNNL